MNVEILSVHLEIRGWLEAATLNYKGYGNKINL